MKIFFTTAMLCLCLLLNAQDSRHPRQLKGSFYFNCDDYLFLRMAVQQSGKVLVCASSAHNDDADILLMRFNTDGTPDTDFGNRGSIFFDLGGYKDVPVFMQVTPEDDILIGAMADNAYSYRTMRGFYVLIKLDQNGNYRSSFGVGGKCFEKPDRRYKGLMAAAVQQDHSIYVLQRYDFRNQFDFGITALDPSGNINPYFGNNGRVNGSTRKFDDNGLDICLQADGKVLVTGQSHTGPSDTRIGALHSPVDVYVYRFNPDGSPDDQFGNRGKVISEFGTGNKLPCKVASLPDGSIRVAGTVTGMSKRHDAFIFGLLSNGETDTAFAKNGLLMVRHSGHTRAHGMLAADSGKFYLAGEIFKGSSPYVFIHRYDAYGKLDTAFNKTGKLLLPYVSGEPVINLLPDGKIVVGSMATIERRKYFVVTRYLPNGKIDPEFGQQ